MVALADELLGFPRHLGIHSGGMVICDRPVSRGGARGVGADGGPHASCSGTRTTARPPGLVKFDLLGLGMLTALHLMIDLVAEHHGRKVELHELQPTDPEVYAMLQRADSVGVFQVESRAQMATLPRLKPREFYDLVVEVALIRPGPIQGGSVHPYIRRRNGLEELGPTTTRCSRTRWRRRSGVPLFQEQLMQIAVDVAGFSAADADELRRAMGAKRSTEKMERLRGRFFDGMAANGITGELAEKIFDKMLAFANFGFPESHSISFASLVYYSAWFKLLLPGGVLRGAAQLPADGLLLPAVAGGRRPPARGARPRPGRQPRAGPRRCCSPTRRSDGRAGHPAGAGRGAHDRAGAGRGDRRRARARRPVPRPRRPGRAGCG